MKNYKRSIRREIKEKRKKYAKKIYPYDENYYVYADNMARYSYLFSSRKRNKGGKKILTRKEYINLINYYEYMKEIRENKNFLFNQIKKQKIRKSY